MIVRCQKHTKYCGLKRWVTEFTVLVLCKNAFVSEYQASAVSNLVARERPLFVPALKKKYTKCEKIGIHLKRSLVSITYHYFFLLSWTSCMFHAWATKASKDRATPWEAKKLMRFLLDCICWYDGKRYVVCSFTFFISPVELESFSQIYYKATCNRWAGRASLCCSGWHIVANAGRKPWIP